MAKNRSKTINRFSRWTSARANNAAYAHYYNMLKEIAISMFKWEGLPDSVDPRFLELILFEQGCAVFFRDEVLGELALQVVIAGELNVYQIPVMRQAYAVNGYQRMLSQDDSVIIFNNWIHTNMVTEIEYFAWRLANAERTIDVNMAAQKTPTAIICSEEQRLTMLNLYAQYEGNEPFIFGNKNLDLKGITTINTGAPYIADKAQNTKQHILNDALTFLGVPNMGIYKAERVGENEQLANMGQTVATRFSRWKARQQACEQINRMFGLNVSCDYEQELQIPTFNAINGEETTVEVEAVNE